MVYINFEMHYLTLPHFLATTLLLLLSCLSLPIHRFNDLHCFFALSLKTIADILLYNKSR